jgi:hypothetical protein
MHVSIKTSTLAQLWEIEHSNEKSHAMRNLYILLFLFTSQLAFAQPETDYSKKWFFGLNAGGTWHTTDIQNVTNSGWGFTLGKSYNYSYGRFASYDVRLRFLRGYWYGQELDTTMFGTPNQALSQGLTNYKDSMGFGIQNFQNENYKLNLELVAHLNRVRERTRFDPYIFGGIGLSFNQAYGDYLQYDTTGGVSKQVMHAYDPSNISKSSLKSLQDEVYETALDGSKQNKFNASIMPSLGFGLGYQIGLGTTVGFEHKSTFAMHDEFDGYTKASQYGMDIYHYSNLYIQWRFRGEKEKRIKAEEPVYTEEIENSPPKVTFKAPNRSGLEVSNEAYTIRANVEHVDAREDISFIQNGKYVADFSFDPANDELSSNVRLIAGQNVFEITGVNQFGSDVESTIVIFKKDEKTPPVVRFIQPSSNPTTVNQVRFNVVARVLNVNSKSQVKVEVNGVYRQSFIYDTISHKVSFPLDLQVGNNVVTVTGTNKDGLDSKTTTIIYERRQSNPAPIVYFTDPSSSPFTVTSADFELEAKIIHVNGGQNVTFKKNGINTAGFSFNSNNDLFRINVILQPGQNIFELYGTNTEGTSSAKTIIIYERQAPKPPVVTISNPSRANEVVANANYSFVGSVLNVTAKSQVSVKLNGSPISNFSFNASNGQAVSTLLLIEGNNNVILKGLNQDGSDEKSVNIIYRKAQTQNPPQVNIYDPSSNPFTSTTQNYSLKSSIANVDNSAGVSLRINGQSNTNWSYSNGQFSSNINLLEGANVVTVYGVNNVGSDHQSVTIYYRKPQTVDPPIVSFMDPTRNPMTVSTGNYFVKAKVENIGAKSDIIVMINGQAAQSFAYQVSSQTVSFNSALIEGSNVFTVKGTNSAGSDSKTTTIVYRKPQIEKPPVVSIMNPSQSKYTSSSPIFEMTVEIFNVELRENIEVTTNGTETRNFSFDGSQDRLTMNVTLAEGDNLIKIKGTNSAGSSSDECILIYRKPVVVSPPKITYTNPTEPGTIANNRSLAVEAKVYGVDNVSQIKVKKDGQFLTRNSYTFNTLYKIVTVPTTLKLGNNIFEVIATNNGGSVIESTNIVYKKLEEPCDNPVISIVKPKQNPASVNDSIFGVEVDVTGLASGGKIDFYLNGKILNVSKRPINSRFSITVDLEKGMNTLQMSATNSCGNAEEVLRFKYVPLDSPCDQPVIALVEPSQSNQSIEHADMQVKIRATGVSSTSAISLLVNNVAQRFAFDQAQGMITANLNLKVGNNKVTVSASNSCGQANLTFNVIRMACVAPSLNLESSSVPNNGQTYNASVELLLDVNDVDSRNQLSATVNERSTALTFNGATNTVSLSAALNSGLNQIVVDAQNECGQTSYTHRVTRQAQPRVTSPTVQVTNPSVSSVTVESGTFELKLKTTNISDRNDLLIKLNGTTLNVNFNESTQTANVLLSLREGANQVVVTAINEAGNVSDMRTITYKKPIVVLKPMVQIVSPSSSVITVPLGAQTISGKIRNVENPGQLTIKVNGKVVNNVKKTIIKGELNYSFVVNAIAGQKYYRVEVIAKNEAGIDRKVLVIKLSEGSSEKRKVASPKETDGQKAPTRKTPPGGGK